MGFSSFWNENRVMNINLQDSFDFWNITIFGESLLTPELRLMSENQIIDEQGECFSELNGFVLGSAEQPVSEAWLTINVDFCDDWYTFHSTLLHEMVHIWQLQNDENMNHQKSFRNWQKQILRTTGLKI